MALGRREHVGEGKGVRRNDLRRSKRERPSPQEVEAARSQ
jgi:hypothetical protein